MFSTVLQNLKTYFGDSFGQAFILGVFLPVLIFVSLSLALYLEITQGLGTAIAAWDKLSGLNQFLLVLAELIFVLVLAYLIYNFQYSFIRLFEGYWPNWRPVNYLRGRFVERQRKRWNSLDDQAHSIWNTRPASAKKRSTTDGNVPSIWNTPEMLKKVQIAKINEIMDQQLAYYPPSTHLDQLMPTRIGNILRAAELYPYDRYGIDSPVIWTRLIPLLKSDVLAPLQSIKIARDFMLLMSTLLVIFTLIWCPVLAILTNNWILFVLCALGWPFAWLCYQNAVQSSVAYAEQLKAIFDLHRHELFDALGLDAPKNEDEERQQWQNIAYFFFRNLPMPGKKVLGWTPQPKDKQQVSPPSPPKGAGKDGVNEQ